MFKFSTFIKDIASIKRTMMLSTLLFVIGILIGWVGTDSIAQFINQQIDGIRVISQGLSESDNPQWSFFVFIFLNNSIKGVMIIFLGIFLGILPIIFLMVNGMVLGYLVHHLSLQGESMFEVIVKGLLPHGIIEIPAIIIACAFGLRLGTMVWISMGVGSKEKRANVGQQWRSFFKRVGPISMWIVILLLVAAIIESTLTFWLMQ
ncbi:stage II sporulation protein M [Paenibacillus sp. FA6]|uniref:stage II sporulation protein M n=1 Tax=Paenibacillus sp. FA6 TaxID=3413029 RepID=UPI003F65EDB9